MDRTSLFSELGEIPFELCKLLEDNVLLWFPCTQDRAVSSRGRAAMKLLHVGLAPQELIQGLLYKIQMLGPAPLLISPVIWKTLFI